MTWYVVLYLYGLRTCNSLYHPLSLMTWVCGGSAACQVNYGDCLPFKTLGSFCFLNWNPLGGFSPSLFFGVPDPKRLCFLFIPTKDFLNSLVKCLIIRYLSVVWLEVIHQNDELSASPLHLSWRIPLTLFRPPPPNDLWPFTPHLPPLQGLQTRLWVAPKQVLLGKNARNQAKDQKIVSTERSRVQKKDSWSRTSP